MQIYVRLGLVSEEEARRRLTAEIQRIGLQLQQKANVRPRFADAAARYLEQSRDNRAVDVTKWHVRLLTPYIGTLELNRIHNRRLEGVIADRRESGVTATTINRCLEAVRTILYRAARSYRDDDGRPWLGLSASARTVDALHGDYSETWRVMNYSSSLAFTRESLSGATGGALVRVRRLYLPIEVEPEVSPPTPMSTAGSPSRGREGNLFGHQLLRIT